MSGRSCPLGLPGPLDSPHFRHSALAWRRLGLLQSGQALRRRNAERQMAQPMDQAADGVWLVTGTDVNWVLVADGDEVTLVDTGEPRDWAQLLSSLERIGRALED